MTIDSPVIFKLILPSEGLPTDVTGEGTFVRMCTFVYCQVVGLAELSIAEATNILLLGSPVGTINNKTL